MKSILKHDTKHRKVKGVKAAQRGEEEGSPSTFLPSRTRRGENPIAVEEKTGVNFRRQGLTGYSPTRNTTCTAQEI
jgi:hypothetical protein